MEEQNNLEISEDLGEGLNNLEEDHKFSQHDVDRIIDKKYTSMSKKARKEALSEYETHEEIINILKENYEEEDIENLKETLRRNYMNDDDKEEILKKDKDDYNLGLLDSKDILKKDDEEILSEYEKLKDIKNRNIRQESLFRSLEKHFLIKDEENKLLEMGADLKILEDESFNYFASSCKEDMPLSDIYKRYMHFMDNVGYKKPVGSLKDRDSTVKIKSYYSKEEASRFSQDDLVKNPNLLKRIENSMRKW